MNQNLDFELVLPCYNEENNLEMLIRRAKDAAENHGFHPTSFQLVVVENGSKDKSSEKLAQLSETDLGKWFRVVPIKENRGYGFGLQTGLTSTKAGYIGWSHADMQCDPNDAFLALKALKAKDGTVDWIIKGRRYERNWKDRFVSFVFAVLARIILGNKIDEINAQPKVFQRKLMSLTPDPPPNFAFDLYMLHKALQNGYRIDTIPVRFPPRIHGVSNWASTFLGRYKTILGMIQYMLALSKQDKKGTT